MQIRKATLEVLCAYNHLNKSLGQLVRFSAQRHQMTFFVCVKCEHERNTMAQPIKRAYRHKRIIKQEL
jgi:hypothetical protein